MPGSVQNWMPWTREEDAELMRLRQLGRTYAQCAEAVGRTVSACWSRMAWLAKTAGRESLAPNPWTREEDARLRELWSVLSVVQIAERLGRTPKGVYRRAGRIGLASGKARPGKAWTAGDDAVLRENAGTMTYAEIGALLGRTEKSVKQRALSLNVRGGAKPRPPKLDNVKRKCHDCGRPTPDYRCPACWRKLRAEKNYSMEDGDE